MAAMFYDVRFRIDGALAASLLAIAFVLQGCGGPSAGAKPSPAHAAHGADTAAARHRHMLDAQPWAECAQGSRCRLLHAEARDLVHPTQAVVGHASVFAQYISDWEGKTPEEVQAKLDRNPTPVVIGPGGRPYAVDGHHGLCCLDLWASETNSSLKVALVVDVLCDKSDLTTNDFEKFLLAENFAYLLARPLASRLELPRPISLRDLPPRIHFSRHGADGLGDDLFRSLAAFVRFSPASPGFCHAHGRGTFCKRAYKKVCDEHGAGIPFVEFVWAYYLNDAFLDPSKWESRSNFDTFQLVVRTELLGITDLDRFDISWWHKAALLANPVCRGEAAQQYVPPKYFKWDALPGVVHSSDELLVGDPECQGVTSPKQCSVPSSFLARPTSWKRRRRQGRPGSARLWSKP